jgi:eukaryotic-like serine/threonine-protein kinase
VDGIYEMAASLLSLARTIFGPDFWPGAWAWATITAGFLLALSPILGSFVIAMIRKGTGNAYNSVTITIFATIGLLTALIVPWLMAIGISHVVGTEASYLGHGQNVYEVLTRPQGGPLFVLDIAKLVVLPGLSALFVILQARTAMRRGPMWPGRLIWLPFVAFLVFSAGVEAEVAFLLWIGFLPASVLGMMPVLVIGPPTWTTINRSVQEDKPQIPAGQRSQHAQNPQSQQAMNPSHQNPPPYQPHQQPQKPPPYVPEPPPPPYRPEGPIPPLLSGKSPGQELLSGHQQPSKLADTPGPLPFPLGGVAPVPPLQKPQTRQMTGGGGSMWTQSGGRFQKIKALGHGGFGTVWLAMDTQLDRTVAVKIAHAPDAETEERMLREARALAAVRHPNCVRVYDIVEDENGLGIVMEFIEGNALADVVQDVAPLDDIAAARLWVTMAGALSAAHAKGVLHRDIKPSNVMIDPSGMPHLIDFGIARSKGDSTLTKTGMMVGTPDFLAPETAAGQPASPASDAWQLAATVAYALTGEPPRGTRENPMAALMAAAKAERISHLPSQSVHLRLLSAALAPDPAGWPTLETVIRQTGGWLSKGGHTEDGPVTRVVKREDLGLDRTKVTPSDPDRTKISKPVQQQPQRPPQQLPSDEEPPTKRHNPTRRFGT